MRRALLSALCAVVAPHSFCQWVAAGLPYQTVAVTNAHKDTLGDALYFCGETYHLEAWTIAKYHLGAWSSFGSFQGTPSSIAAFGDTLFVGGGFPSGNGIAVPSLQCSINNSWSACGAFVGPIYRLKIINEDLYAIGAFTQVDG